MIVNQPLISQIGQGVVGAQLQSGDGVLFVPPTLLNTTPLWLPTQPLTSSTTLNRTSFFTEFELVKTNAGVSNDLICTLGRGVWSIDITMGIKGDFTTMTAGASIALNLANGIFSIASIFRAPFHAYEIAYNKNATFTLPDDTYTIVLRVGALGVGQTQYITLGLVANKVL